MSVMYSYLKNLLSQLGEVQRKDNAITKTKKPDIELFCQFVDSSSLDFRSLNLLPDRAKPWRDEEKEMISLFLDELHASVPGLLTLAASGRSIDLIRVTALVYTSGLRPCALAGQYTIILADSFFSAPDPLYSFVHELTHVADDAYFVAFSKEWVELAEPLMQQYLNEKDVSAREVFLETKWPSAYACENLVEALAEYVACYATNKYFDSLDLFERTIVPLIVSPDPRILEWKQAVSRGRVARDTQNMEVARKEFERASKLFPEKPFPYLQMAGIAASSADYKQSIFYTAKMIDSFKMVLSSSHIELDYIYLILRTFAASASADKTREFATWLLRRYPGNAEIDKYS
ncbi:MAG: hypothetical protein IPP97_16975 [Candidatus Obscuribacter sp.]|nr:hypothetical protein [Candidatus Obscuribacter sp.]MBP6593162.1 hypothetical protein [Candidatus Obscuribacter sp.]MBP7576177.1 hypothetical protein [Candidatus Obscuribacter sp.]